MTTVVAAVQVRLASSRLPGKAFLNLSGRSALNHIMRRLVECMMVDHVVVACPARDKKPIQKHLAYEGVRIVTGPEDDVLTRMLNVVDDTGADYLLRVTADCPLICPDLIDRALRELIEADWTVVGAQNWRPRTWPDGLDFDAWRAWDLRAVDKVFAGKEREYFAQAMLDRGLPTVRVRSKRNWSRARLTLDYPEDLEVLRRVFSDMGDEVWMSEEILAWCDDNPDVLKVNEKRVDGRFGELPR